MKKDDIVTLTIEDISSEGLGVGRSDGIALFVKDTVIGDVVEAKVMKMKKTYGFARLMNIVEPSADRIQPPCPVARLGTFCHLHDQPYCHRPLPSVAGAPCSHRLQYLSIHHRHGYRHHYLQHQRWYGGSGMGRCDSGFHPCLRCHHSFYIYDYRY